MTAKEYRAAYPYLYETHLHTTEGSACAGSGGAGMAYACKTAGYTGIFVTDHNWHGNTAVDKSLPWEAFVERFTKGYEAVKRVGDRIGLDVFFGWEAGYDGTEFLIYGLSKEWLLRHPEIRDASVEEQFSLVHAGGGIVVHAHPFREEYYIPQVRLFPDAVDGVEGINAAHRMYAYKKVFDERAIAYGREHGFPLTAGSDIHSVNLSGGGMAFRRRLADEADFVGAVRAQEDYILTDGERIYDRDGRVLA